MVQQRLGEALDACAPGPIRLVSLCAGQGHDVLGVLPEHPRRDDVTARLVELDPDNAADARARAAGLPGVEVVTGDAADLGRYVGAVPADVVLVCGIFGNISDDDIRHAIEHLSMLCAPGATVLWTRRRHPPEVMPAIRSWFAGAGFEPLHLDVEDDHPFAVGTERFVGEPTALDPTVSLFTFIA